MNPCFVAAGLALLAMAGALQASPCEVTSSHSDIDHGARNRTTVALVGGEVELPVKRLQLSVHCATPQAISLAYLAAAQGQAFRFADWGHYGLTLHDIQLDGRSAELLGQGAAPGQPAVLLPGQVLHASRDGLPATGQRLTARVDIHARGNAAALAGSAQAWQAHGVFHALGGQRPLRQQVAFAPAACVPRLSQGGHVDFGRINAQQLAETATTTFERALSLDVRCDGPTRFALVAHDNRAGSARLPQGLAPGAAFGLGPAGEGLGPGAYRLQLDAPHDDQGNPLQAFQGGQGMAWTTAGALPSLFHSGPWLGFAPAAGRRQEPAPLSGMSARLQVQLHLAPRQVLQLKQEVVLRGAATLEIVYL